MYPLIPFAAGLLAGVFGVRLLKTVKTPDLDGVAGSAREQLGRAQDIVRQATVSGLSAVEQSSASLRTRLTPQEPVPAAEAAPEVAPEPAPAAPATPKPKAKRAARPRAPRKTAAPESAA